MMTNYIKDIHLIHFNQPSTVSVMSTSSFSSVYDDWNIILHTEEKESWKNICNKYSLKNVEVRDVKIIEDLIETTELSFIFAEAKRYSYRYRSDITRLAIVCKYGGMYADTDIIATRKLSKNVILEAVHGDRFLISEEYDGDHFIAYTNPWFYAYNKQNIFIRYWLEGYIPNLSLWPGYRRDKYQNQIWQMDSDDRYFEYIIGYPTFLGKTVLPPRVKPLSHKLWYEPRDVYSFFREGNIEDYKEAIGFHLWNNLLCETGLIDQINYNNITKNKDMLIASICKPYLAIMEDFENASR